MTDISFFSDILPIQQMKGDSHEDTEMLIKMAQDADVFITSFRWCPAIKNKYFGFGVGGIVAVFLYHFSLPIDQSDDWLWVIVGDLPSAYLVIDATPTPANALDVYCKLMEEWAKSIISDHSTEGCYPVNVAPTPKNAQLLLNRMGFIRKGFLS